MFPFLPEDFDNCGNEIDFVNVWKMCLRLATTVVGVTSSLYGITDGVYSTSVLFKRSVFFARIFAGCVLSIGCTLFLLNSMQ